MKKLLTILSCLVLIISLCACSNSQEQIETEQQAQISRFDCHEYDIINQTFTDNILISINLTNDFISTDQTELLIQDNKFYIGEFKRLDAEGNVNKTVSLFELNDSNFSFTDCSKVSTNWSISNVSLENDNTYTRIFYTQQNDYVIGMSIVNTDKNNLSVEDALQNLAFIVNEECTVPENNTIPSVVVEGSLKTPARTGEWVSTMLYNPEIDDYEPVCISITKVETGESADTTVNNYNNLLDIYNGEIKSELMNPADCVWAVYKYSIFFPSSFTATKNIENIEIPITYCNINDDGGGIKGYLELQQSQKDISPAMKNVKPGSIWSEGIGFFEIPINANYLIKIQPSENSESIKYFKP